LIEDSIVVMEESEAHYPERLIATEIHGHDLENAH
jgi:hypothetical protein